MYRHVYGHETRYASRCSYMNVWAKMKRHVGCRVSRNARGNGCRRKHRHRHRRVYEKVCGHAYKDTCVDTHRVACVDMCIDMCIVMGVDMCIDMCIIMCEDKCMDRVRACV